MLFPSIWIIVGGMSLAVFYEKWLHCLFVKWLISYIQFIDWFSSCLDLYFIHFISITVARMLLAVFTRSDFVVCLWNDYYLTFRLLIDSLLAWIRILFYFYLNYCSRYVIGCFYENRFHCMVFWMIVFYIQFIDWFFTCFDIYFVPFRLNCFSPYVFTSIKRSDFFVFLGNIYYLTFRSLIDSLFT